MDSFKEFQGKSLDEAISEACGYFDAPREKLEIEILQDSKSGIFGLVGARKAKVRARRAPLRTAVEDILGRKSGLALPADGGAESLTEKGQSEKSQDDEGRENTAGHTERHERREKRDGAGSEEKCEKQERHDTSCVRPEKADRGQDKLHDRHRNKDRGDCEHKERDPRERDEQGRAGAESAGLVEPEAAVTAAMEKCEKGERSDRTDKIGRADTGERAERAERPDRQDRRERSDGPGGPSRPDRPGRAERQDRRAKPAPKTGARRAERQGERPVEGQGEGRPRSAPPSRPRHDDGPYHGAALGEDVLHEDGDDLQRIPFEDLDQDKLRSLSLEVVAKLVAPIVGDLPLTVGLQDGRVNVRMDCGDDSGLLIGREGQTLASLQYLASRMVSRGMSAAVRVQLDAGEYRLRQDEKLREMALSLAEKVQATGKSHSTRPLSSYHRRIVHLVLQESPDVQTRSSGDGPLKRVVVQRKR